MSQHQIRYIQHGEPLTPEVANRAAKDIVEWLSALDNRVAGYTDVSNTVIYDQPLSEETFIGCPVYYNTETGLFTPARASTHVENHTLFLDPCGWVLGLVIEKTSTHSGHIALSGIVEIDIRNADNFYRLPPGIRYLSVNIAGQLEQQIPPISIPVCFVLSTDHETKKSLVAVAISLDNVLSGHKHYKFKLSSVPAGDYTEFGRTIEYPGELIDGWLPADHVSFEGLNIPANAKFGYNINRSVFKKWWPPAVLNAFSLHWQTASTEDTTPIMGEVPPELYKANYDGIWWLTDEPYLLPWYRGIGYVQGQPNGLATPPKVQQRMVAYFTQLTFNTHNAVVTSLQAVPTSGLRIFNANSPTEEPATVGDLKIDFDLSLKEADRKEPGSVVLKRVKENELYFGSVVESIRVDSRSLVLIPDEEYPLSENGRAQGNVLIRASDSWHGTDLSIQSVHLDQIKDTYIGDVVGLSFYRGQQSGLSGQTMIPLQATTPKQLYAKLRFQFVAHEKGTIDTSLFTAKWKVIPPADEGIPLDFPMTAEELTLKLINSVTELTITKPYQYFCIDSASVPVIPGGILWFSLYRKGRNEIFPYDLTMIRRSAVLLTQPE
jgi:hypothetical protein